MTTNAMSIEANNDAGLVGESLAGNREAFGQIVARYQSLVCSLAYNATGSLSQSEDLAQETFIAAWKQLSGLREPEKLRPWLCAIARNLIHNTLRRQGREPAHAAEPMELAHESPSHDASPPEQAISNEEEAILWRSIERIPETYREPLILFYRGHESVERVAAALDLSEDAVHQRLSRGRKMLQEQVLAFVEGALEKTAPGRNFTLGVIAALPLAVTSAKAAAVGTTIAKGGAAAKSAATLGSLGGLFVLLGGIYISLRAQADDTKSPREQEFMRQMIGVRLVFFLVTCAVFVAVKKLVFFQQPLTHDIAFATMILAFTATGILLMDYSIRRQRQIQTEDGTLDEAEWTKSRWKTEPLFTPANGQPKSKNIQKAAKFMALPMIFAMYLVIWTPDQQFHLSSNVLIFGVIFMLSAFGGWRQRPRYQNPKLGWRIGMLAMMAALTLRTCNNPQPELQGSDAISSTTMMVFNTVVVTTYAVFAAILFLRNRLASKAP